MNRTFQNGWGIEIELDQWYFSQQLLIAKLLNYLEYVLCHFLISAYLPILVCKQAMLSYTFDAFCFTLSLIVCNVNSRLRWYMISSIVNRTRSTTFSKYLCELWKYLLTFLAKDLFLNFRLLNVLKVSDF